MCEGLHKDSGARCRSDVPWNGLLRDHFWYDDGGPGMTQNLAELAEGTYMWWCSEPTICLQQCHWTDGDRDGVDCVIWNVTRGTNSRFQHTSPPLGQRKKCTSIQKISARGSSTTIRYDQHIQHVHDPPQRHPNIRNLLNKKLHWSQQYFLFRKPNQYCSIMQHIPTQMSTKNGPHVHNHSLGYRTGVPSPCWQI